VTHAALDDNTPSQTKDACEKRSSDPGEVCPAELQICNGCEEQRYWWWRAPGKPVRKVNGRVRRTLRV